MIYYIISDNSFWRLKMTSNEIFDIPIDNPFQNDKLDRKNIAENLENIIDSINGSVVLSIDASWGNGKTTFIKMWKQKIDNEAKYKAIYFNAWENDDCEDPLLALINEITELLKTKEENSKIIDGIKKYGKPLLKKAIPTMLKIATSGAIDFSEVGLQGEKKYLVDLAGQLGEFDAYNEQKASRENFKKMLSELQAKENRKIIFFIDELDRCRPTFAVETLEKIKHLFNIDNFIFILSLDRRQLSCSVRTLYGQEIDAIGYLRRFIDIEFMLPEPNRMDYTDLLIDKYHFKNKNSRYFEYYLKSVIDAYNLSLRDIEKLFHYLNLLMPGTIIFKSVEQNYKNIYLDVLGVIYSLLPVLKIKNPELYKKFLNREIIDKKEIIIINIPENDEETVYYYNDIISKLVILNNHLKTGTKHIVKESFFAGRADDFFNGRTFDLQSLLSDNRSEFAFVRQFEFVNKFIMPE